MQRSASDPLGPLGLTNTEPPLSPETVGRAPGSSSFLDGAVALKPIPAFPRVVPRAAAPESRRLVLRLLGGEELELAEFENREEAMAAAAALVAELAAAEASGDWPEVDGRFLRPGSIASVDVLGGD